MMDKHYEEQTVYITLEGVTPFANSTPIDITFLDKKFKKVLKKSGIDCDYYMNVIFEKSQNFENKLEWKLHDHCTDVFLIGETKLFIKGKHFYVYCIGIVND